MHLIRVTHDKANYFRPAPPGTQSVDIDVFNAAAKVEGVTGEAVVIRLQTDETGKNLKVVQNFFIKNDSAPPRTQFSDHAFEFFLPPGAIVSGSAALGPGSMPVQSSPIPLGDPNHYAFVFPIRPGETRFQVTYQLPYTGSFQFDPKVSLPTDTVAIMMPKSMTFKASGAVGYSPVTEETTAQTYVARNAQPSEPLGFTVTGSGQLPRDEAQGATSGSQHRRPRSRRRHPRPRTRRHRHPPRRRPRQPHRPHRLQRPLGQVQVVDHRRPRPRPGRRRRLPPSLYPIHPSRRSPHPREPYPSSPRHTPLPRRSTPPRRAQGRALLCRNRPPPGQALRSRLSRTKVRPRSRPPPSSPPLQSRHQPPSTTPNHHRLTP